MAGVSCTPSRRIGEPHGWRHRAGCRKISWRNYCAPSASVSDLGWTYIMKLAGRFAIVTGASMGLGAEIAERFVAACAGVMLCARNKGELEAQCARIASRHLNARIESQVADIADERQV